MLPIYSNNKTWYKRHCIYSILFAPYNIHVMTVSLLKMRMLIFKQNFLLKLNLYEIKCTDFMSVKRRYRHLGTNIPIKVKQYPGTLNIITDAIWPNVALLTTIWLYNGVKASCIQQKTFYEFRFFPS